MVVGSTTGHKPTSVAAATAAAAVAAAPAGDELLVGLDSDTSFGDLAGVMLEEIGQEPISLAAIDSLLSPMEVADMLQDLQ
jgi:hypothetical protein